MFLKNTAVTGFMICNFIAVADGSTVTTGTPTCKRLLDGTAAAMANAASYNADALAWEIDLAAADTNADMVGYSFTLATCLPISVTVRTTLNLVGTAQTGDAYARLGAPAGASVSADVAAVKAQTAAIETDTQDLQTQVGVDGAGLTALPWNAAWDAQVESEVADALGVYDPPTKGELDTAVAALATAAALATVAQAQQAQY